MLAYYSEKIFYANFFGNIRFRQVSSFRAKQAAGLRSREISVEQADQVLHYFREGVSLNIYIVAVGKLKEKFWKDACAEYLKRLGPYAKLQVVEVADASAEKLGGTDKALAAEEVLILKALEKLPGDTRKILLDIKIS